MEYVTGWRDSLFTQRTKVTYCNRNILYRIETISPPSYIFHMYWDTLRHTAGGSIRVTQKDDVTEYPKKQNTHYRSENVNQVHGQSHHQMRRGGGRALESDGTKNHPAQQDARLANQTSLPDASHQDPRPARSKAKGETTPLSRTKHTVLKERGLPPTEVDRKGQTQRVWTKRPSHSHGQCSQHKPKTISCTISCME